MRVPPDKPEDISLASYVRKILTEILLGEFMKKSNQYRLGQVDVPSLRSPVVK